MQSISPLTLDQLMATPQEILYKLEIYDGSAWQDLTNLGSKNYLKSVSMNLGGPGVSPDPIAGSWSAVLSNEGGIFHPRHPTSSYTSLLRVGRKVRISVGAKIGGTSYYWQRLIGYLDSPNFDNSAKNVSLSGLDYTKLLTDTILKKPSNYWGSSVTLNSIASTPVLGSEIYTYQDSIAGGSDSDDVSAWTAAGGGSITSQSDTGGGSNFVMEIDGTSPNIDAIAYRDGIGSLTAGQLYKVSFKYKKVTGGANAELRCYIYPSGGGGQMGVITGLKQTGSYGTATFYFTAAVSGAVRVQFDYYEWPSPGARAYRIDALSIKPVTSYTNARYSLPSNCKGPYYATLDGVPHWMGDQDQGWFWDSVNNQFYFADDYMLQDGTNNLVVYYFTTQALENVVADLLVAAGLYASEAAALADMDYVATGIAIDRVWFEAGTTALDAIKLCCERANYRFWFNETGKPCFKPAPTAGGIVAAFRAKHVSTVTDYQDRTEIKNSITISGIQQSMYQTSETAMSSRLQGSASDATSIAAYTESDYSTTNDLFQDQGSIDAMAAKLLAAWKDPKWYSEVKAPINAVPVQRGDTISWEVFFTPALGDGKKYGTFKYGDGTKYGDGGIRAIMQGIVRDFSISEGALVFKCQVV